ncbi:MULTISPECIES: hypothetical protein [unclassified Mesorhizobium]|uniref:hypothetical protein n=1 Tax=unclassified Mesorhizobium TaxID=325217 RepID=UPI000FCA37FF|nr:MULTISPECIES: hypothetical protein [unclassified Mesorhizobium]RUV24266.1 hypothetical protein EOA91_12645 [Mesorhizobium sp. M1A.F.Ca.IN.022.04.1.1]RWG26817.1 MAG: hypothetical protein EOQ60_26700 [Mesorhizobium sp.]
MSLVNAMLRMLAVQALRGNTIAADGVTDSSIEALSSIMSDRQAPVILVRIDESKYAGQNEGFFVTSGTVTFALDLIVASSVTYQTTDGQAVNQIEIAPTDAGLEFSLDMLDRQWRRVLSDPNNAFAECFRSLVAAIGPVKAARGVDPEGGRKHAIRMVEIEIEPVCDPAPGAELPPVIDAALTKLATVADYQSAVVIMRGEFAKGVDLMSWQKIQSTLMTTAAVPAMLGVAPPDAGEVVGFDQVGTVINGEQTELTDDILPDPDLGGSA